MASNLVSVKWLNDNLNAEDTVLVMASQDGLGDQVIPGTRLFDLKQVFRDTSSDLPNTFPSEVVFEEGMRDLGINQDTTVVIYDKKGIYFSPRVWFLMRAMGKQHVYVLDGGLPAWQAERLPTTKPQSIAFPLGDFTTELKTHMVRHLDFMKSNSLSGEVTVLDARSKGRFEGTAPEPREGLDSGHIPNSQNLPFTEVLNQGKMKPAEDLKSIFAPLVTSNDPLIFSCGSGITACIIMLAADEVLSNEKSVYDGSWTEWKLNE